MRTKHKIIAVALPVALATMAYLSLPKHVGPDYLYPNSKLTPGKIATQSFQELTAINSCGTYSQCHRNTTSQQKNQICQEYSNNCKGIKEIDHFCPLALGCADDIANLWAQPEHNIWNGIDYGFHIKDKLETYMIAQMKAGKITPKEAQDCILNDWVKCYQKYLGGKLGAFILEDSDDEIY